MARVYAHPIEAELRDSLVLLTLAWALVEAHAAFHGQPMPESWAAVSPMEKRRYQAAALVALRALDPDAHRFAKRSASYRAIELFEQWVKDRGLDWLDVDNQVNERDALECLLQAVSDAAVKRYGDVLAGTYPGLAAHERRLARIRRMDAVPEEEGA